MFKLTYENIMNTGFQQAISTLASNDKMPARLAYNLTDMAQRLEKHRKKIVKAYEVELLPKFAKFEGGKPVRSPSAPGFVLLDGISLDDFEAAKEAFGATEFEVDRDPLTAEWLLQASPTISPADLGFLLPIIGNPEAFASAPADGRPKGPRAV